MCSFYWATLYIELNLTHPWLENVDDNRRKMWSDIK